MAVYEHPSSKTHIQITSSSPNGSSDTRMMAGRGGGCNLVVPLSPFHVFQLIDFHPVSPQLYHRAHQFVFVGLITCYIRARPATLLKPSLKCFIQQMLDRRPKKRGAVIKLSVSFGGSKRGIEFIGKIIYHVALRHCDYHDRVHQKYKSPVAAMNYYIYDQMSFFHLSFSPEKYQKSFQNSRRHHLTRSY